MRAMCACAMLFAGLAVAAAPVPKEPAVLPVNEEHLKAARLNLKHIALAFHAHHDVYGRLPNNVCDKNGKALLSWRVQILPYLDDDHAQLFGEFKLDEAWDSDHNKKLIEKLPKHYAPIRVKAKAGETFYQVFTGDGAPFGGKQAITLVAITDGTSNTGMVFEAGAPVIWTKPDDLVFDAKKALPKLGGLFDGEFHVAVCDGSVILVKKDYDAAEMKHFITHNGGEVLDTDKLKK
jgi:hypothetical protein